MNTTEVATGVVDRNHVAMVCKFFKTAYYREVQTGANLRPQVLGKTEKSAGDNRTGGQNTSRFPGFEIEIDIRERFFG